MSKISAYLNNFKNQMDKLGFCEGEQERILQKTYSVKLTKKEEFVINYSKSALIYLKSGLLKILRTLPDESEVGTLVLSDPTLFTLSVEWDDLYQGTERLVCLDNAEILIFSGAHLDELLNGNPVARYKLLQFGYIRERFIADEAFLRAKLSKYQWQVLFLAQLLSSKGSIRVTAEDLAEICATTRQFCAGNLAKLEQQGAIRRHYGSIELLSMEKLLESLPDNLIANIDRGRETLSKYYVEAERRALHRSS